MNKYTFYEDPGHGWLKVPMTELVDLGVAGTISSYSYAKQPQLQDRMGYWAKRELKSKGEIA